jgi:hypothetical protein
MIVGFKTLLSISSSAWKLTSSVLKLETYTEVAPTTEMTNIIIKMMVEVLMILGLVTKEIKQTRMSELFMYKYIAVN